MNQLFGANPKDIEKIKAWAKANSLRVVEEDLSKRQVRVEGKISNFSKAFNTSLHEYEHPTLGKFRGRSGDISIADALYKVIDGVFGLDTRPIGHPRLRKGRIVEVPLKDKKTKASALQNDADLASDFPGAFLPTTLAKLYNYPANTDGSGQNIAVFAFNGPPA
jgi:kumamolisin